MRLANTGQKLLERLPIKGTLRLATRMTFLAAVLTLAGLGARWSWLCELTVHWPVQLAGGTATACFVLAIGRRWKWAMLAGIVALVNAAYVVPIYLPKQRESAVRPVCRIVSANVHTSNRNASRFIELIRSETPDFFLVMEVDDHWEQALKVFDDEFPFSVVRARDDNFGIALYSRLPILSHCIESLDESGVPTIVGTIDFHGQPLHVIGTHPLPPIGARRAELNRQHLRSLAQLASQLPSPVIVMGDLNSTSWSPHFNALLREAKLQDSRQGFGPQPTWPSELWAMRIPLDHILTTKDLVVTQRDVGLNIGSDHLPVVVSLAIGDED